MEHDLDLRLPHAREGLLGGAGGRLHAGQRHRLRAGRAGRRALRGRVRAAAGVLLQRPQQRLPGGREVPRRPADVGAHHARPLRRHQPQGADAALPHPDRRRDADRPAAAEQHRPRRAAGLRRGVRRDAVAAHQRLRRGARAALRARGQARAADPAGHRARVRRDRHRGPVRGQLLRRGADRRDRGRRRARSSTASTSSAAASRRSGSSSARSTSPPGATASATAPSRTSSSASTATSRTRPTSRRPSASTPPASARRSSDCRTSRPAATPTPSSATSQAIRAAAEGTDNLLPVLREALRDRCSVGEVCGAMRDVFGTYRPPA